MVHSIEMLGEIIGKVLLSWVPLHIEISHLDLICPQKNRISINLERCFLTVLFAIPGAVRLSQWTGVGLWPISSRVNLRTLPSLQLRNKAPNSNSAADATMILLMLP